MGNYPQAPLAQGSSTVGKAESSEIPINFSSQGVLMCSMKLNTGILLGIYLTSGLFQEMSHEEQDNAQRDASVLSSFSAIS